MPVATQRRAARHRRQAGQALRVVCVPKGTGGLAGGTIDAAHDHRLAMLGAVAGVASREGVDVEGFEASAISYPGFGDDLGKIA